MQGLQLYLPLTPYVIVRDGEPLAAAIANRHYSRIWKGNISQNRIAPPGKRLILLEPLGRWIFGWSHQKFRKDNQTGVECFIFRNESQLLSSEIILLAENAWNDFYGETRKFTYVHPLKIRSTNPGYCFQCVGWRKKPNYRSKSGLTLLIKELCFST